MSFSKPNCKGLLGGGFLRWHDTKVQVVVCVLSKDCLAPTFVCAKQVKYVAIRTHKCPEIKA
jgi:hypothetical protein